MVIFLLVTESNTIVFVGLTKILFVSWNPSLSRFLDRAISHPPFFPRKHALSCCTTTLPDSQRHLNATVDGGPSAQLVFGLKEIHERFPSKGRETDPHMVWYCHVRELSVLRGRVENLLPPVGKVKMNLRPGPGHTVNFQVGKEQARALDSVGSFARMLIRQAGRHPSRSKKPCLKRDICHGDQ